MKNSRSGPRPPVDNDPTGTSGLPIALASLILVILVFVATHAQAKVADVVEFHNATDSHFFPASAAECAKVRAMLLSLVR